MDRTTHIRNLAWTVGWDAALARHVYLRNADVVFIGDRLVHVGPGYTGSADEVVDGKNLLAAPGFVNAHAHPAGELAYRGVREDHGVPAMHMTGLYERIQAFGLDEEGQRACATASFAELLRCGVTTVVDISAPYEGWLEGLANSGLRGYAAASFSSAEHVMRAPHIMDYEWDEDRGRRDFEHCCEVMDQADAHASGRLHAMVSPATIDNVSRDLLAESIALAESTERRLTIHVAESVPEVRNMVAREGMTSVQWAAEVGLLGPRTLLGHAIFLDEHSWVRWFTHRDLDLIAQSGATVAHCPTPFSRYGHVLENFGRYRQAGVNMGIGTDTLPCNLIEEVRTATVLARVAGRDVTAGTLADVYHAATAGGADALGREDLGRLAPGAKADVVLVDLSHPLMRPVRDPIRSLVYSAAERAVRDVYVGGQRVVQDGRTLNIDSNDALERLQEAQARMLAGSAQQDYLGRSAEEISPLTLPVA